MTKQAPLPWTVTQNSWQYTTIYDAEGNSICRLDLEDWNVTESNQDGLEKIQTQIANRIVNAVNHPADVANNILLTTIVSKALEWAGHYPEASDGRNTFVLFAEWVEGLRAKVDNHAES